MLPGCCRECEGSTLCILCPGSMDSESCSQVSWHRVLLALCLFVTGHPSRWEEYGEKELMEDKWMVSVLFVLILFTGSNK